MKVRYRFCDAAHGWGAAFFPVAPGLPELAIIEIAREKTPVSPSMLPIQFDPLIAEWFASRFERATEPQLRGWREIVSGRDVLISAPTGSGKTLAAFLICLDQLVRAARAGALAPEISVVYVSPLKALSNDVHRNLR